MRDHSTIEQLIVLSNLESLNAILIDQNLSARERLEQLNRVAIVQMNSLLRKFVSHVEEPQPEYRVAS